MDYVPSYFFRSVILSSKSGIRLSVLTFFFYWGLPFFVSLIENTALPPGTLEVIFDSFFSLRNENEVIFDDSSLSLTNKSSAYYLFDSAHFLFSIFLCLGVFFLCRFLREILPSVDQAKGNGIFKDESKVKNAFRKYCIKRLGLKAFVIPATASLFVLLFFIIMYYSSSPQEWWGSSSNGYNGLLFSIIVSAMVFFGAYYIENIVISSIMLGRIMATVTHIRPFHPDGCNGLEPIGVLIIYLWGFSICLAGTVFITTYIGYHGIENQIVAWFLAIFSTFSIPMIAIYPLFISVKTVYRLRRERLEIFEKKMSNSLAEIERYISRDNDVKVIENIEILEKIKVVYEAISSINVWPFDTKVLAGAILIYIFQAVMIIKEITMNLIIL